MTTVAIIDYGLCNLDSVFRAVEECGGKPVVTNDPKALRTANRIILPGVGAFPQAMRNLRTLGLDHAMGEQVLEKMIPFLGICLGMQLLAERGMEVESCTGLSWVKGEVVPLKSLTKDDRIPHMGWNEVHHRRQSPLLAGIDSAMDFYFAHSFHFKCSAQEDVLGSTPYCGGICSVLETGNIFGVQFHPEKSQRVGLRLIKNFLNL